MFFPTRPWAWDAGGIPSGCYGLPPDPLPDDPVEFFANCSAWWSWLESAAPEALDAYARTGRISSSLKELVRDHRLMRDARWANLPPKPELFPAGQGPRRPALNGVYQPLPQRGSPIPPPRYP